ncbi:MAG: hypothetical protein KGO96_12345 [Elusimicrobia bacterium]|nr:hypothetical protein [Elusimicrobiota bacterium]
MNPSPDELPEPLVRQISDALAVDWRGREVPMLLDLAGYDTTDDTWVLAVMKHARLQNWDERVAKCAMSRFKTAALTHKEIGKFIGMPTSSVQAIACGRVVERYTEAQRAKLHELFDLCEAAIKDARRLLGK